MMAQHVSARRTTFPKPKSAKKAMGVPFDQIKVSENAEPKKTEMRYFPQ